MKLKLTRRRFLLAGAGVCLGAVVDMRFLEPRWLRTSRLDVGLGRKSLSRPIRILHLSDMHASNQVPVSFIREAIELGLGHKPDLTCLTGDLITGHIPSRKDYVAALRLLSDRGPCFACVGNHDGGNWSRRRGGYPDLSEMFRFLKDANISVLFNTSVKVHVKGTSIRLVGLGDYWADGMNPAKAFAGIDPSEQTPCVVLSHNPDSKQSVGDYAWDLMLCGHTHGGQFSFPLLGTPFAPVQDHRYVDGLNEWNGRLIHTTRGIGNLLGIRFNCRPEISILDVS